MAGCQGALRFLSIAWRIPGAKSQAGRQATADPSEARRASRWLRQERATVPTAGLHSTDAAVVLGLVRPKGSSPSRAIDMLPLTRAVARFPGETGETFGLYARGSPRVCRPQVSQQGPTRGTGVADVGLSLVL